MIVKALLFDVDGTLADTERDGHRLAFNRAFAEAGLDWVWDVPLYGELLAVTGGKERMRHYVERYRPDNRRPADFDELVVRLHARKTVFYTALVASAGVPLRPGVRRLLAEARARGVRLAIATTTTTANVTALLDHTLAPEGEGWFDVIGAGDVVAEKKPAPDIYFNVLERLALEPGECVAFEDSENGVRSARSAGVPVVVTVNEYTRTQDFTGAVVVLDHLGEPDQPCRVLAGASLGDATLLDLAVLKRLPAAS
ncbi:MAG TPA: HAD-IA family hydrolase [Gemmatimonadales bacterium]|nr:HAD-IA family hydrolase [Gemmatimonadales bacterium]